MKKAIWFSCHPPTEDQLREIEAISYQLVGVKEGMALGAKVLASDEDVEAVMDGIAKNLVAFEAEAIFGVFPTTEQAYFRGSSVPMYSCFAAWNAQRSDEGKLPTFCLKKWLQVG